MTGIDVYKKAKMLMGYEESDFVPEAVLAAVNEIGEDLGNFQKAEDLFKEIDADQKTLNALPYGVAMILSLMNNDDVKHSFFCNLYNAKRAAVKYANGVLNDVLPCGSGDNI